MHNDEIKHVAMSDRLICRDADLRMDGLGNKEDRKQDDVYRVSQAARTLGRLLLASRRSVSMPNLSSRTTSVWFGCRSDEAHVIQQSNTSFEFGQNNWEFADKCL